jgi:hypothetical protein
VTQRTITTIICPNGEESPLVAAFFCPRGSHNHQCYAEKSCKSRTNLSEVLRVQAGGYVNLGVAA